MARSNSFLAVAVALGLAAACAPASPAQGIVAEEPYPEDISPPAGTRYPCALTALPRDLEGIPAAERAYVDRTYTRLLRATQAKLVVLEALQEDRDAPAAVARYQEITAGLAERVRTDGPPPGLEAFRDDVAGALALQQAFFAKALPLRQAGRGMSEVYQVPEGREASGRLIAAWTRMQARYPAWSAQTKDSIYHHLCALDLF
jgi:hypothetical protein